jgi:hypothetical protein
MCRQAAGNNVSWKLHLQAHGSSGHFPTLEHSPAVGLNLPGRNQGRDQLAVRQGFHFDVFQEQPTLTENRWELGQQFLKAGHRPFGDRVDLVAGRGQQLDAFGELVAHLFHPGRHHPPDAGEENFVGCLARIRNHRLLGRRLKDVVGIRGFVLVTLPHLDLLLDCGTEFSPIRPDVSGAVGLECDGRPVFSRVRRSHKPRNRHDQARKNSGVCHRHGSRQFEVIGTFSRVMGTEMPPPSEFSLSARERGATGRPAITT